MQSIATPGVLSSASSASSRRFALNLVTNIAQLGVTVVVGAWYVPFLVNKLGPAAYGLVPLTSSITAYMGLITLGLNSAVARYLTISLERKDYQEANLIFNISLWGTMLLCAFLLIPAIAAVVYADLLLNIPKGYETATRWLFGGVIIAFLLNQLKTPFGVSTFCRNRLDLQNLVTVSETLTRVGMVICFFSLFGRKVEYVGAGILLGTVVSTAGTIWLWKVLTPGLHIRLGQFHWQMLKDLCRTGGWVIVSQIGVMLYLNIDLIVANRLFEPEVSGRYAAVLQLPMLLRTLSIAVGGIFSPTMLHIYARGEHDKLIAYLKHSIKFLGLVMALPIGLICGFSEPLLVLWLGPDFSHLAPLLFIMSVHLCFNLAMYPLYALPLATNRVKVPGLVTLGMGVGNLILALLFAGHFNWGVYGLAAAGAITLTLRHLFFTPLYGAHIVGRSSRTFYGPIFSIVFATAVCIGMGRLILAAWEITNWAQLMMAGISVSVLFAAFVYFLLSAKERATLRLKIMEVIKDRASEPQAR